MLTDFISRLLASGRTPMRGAAEPLPQDSTIRRQSPSLPAAEFGSLKGKTVLLTGAAGLIGTGIAHVFAEHGADIVCCDIDEPRQKKLVADLSQYGVRIESVLADISQPAHIDRLGAALDRMNVSVDVLIHSAGLKTSRVPFLEQDGSVWSRIFQTNVTGALHLTQHVCKGMQQRAVRGSIIFITSIHQSTVWGEVGYGASKAALAAAIRELAFDLAPHGIRVNGIAPGAVGQDDQGRELNHSPTPLGQKMITPANIGRAAAFLASDYLSESITGTVIPVDGGLSLHTYLSVSDRP